MGKYKLVRSIRLVGIFLLVYVEHTLADYVSEVESGSVRTGIMGMLVSECVSGIQNREGEGEGEGWRDGEMK